MQTRSLRFDGEVDLFEQERAADAEVDVLEVDQGHPAILSRDLGAIDDLCAEHGRCRR